MKDAMEIILRPLVTEKNTGLQRQSKFAFEVAMDATKVDIQRAIEALGHCEVKKVNTLVVKGKKRRRGTRVGRSSDWKKAVVTLGDGQSLGGLLGQAFETA